MHVAGDKYIYEMGTWGLIEQNESGTSNGSNGNRNKQHISHATGEQRRDTHTHTRRKWGFNGSTRGGAGGSKNSKTMSVDIYSCNTNNLARAHMEERVFGGWLD